jgi:hypothetical protein
VRSAAQCSVGSAFIQPRHTISFAAAFHHLPAVVAELFFLTGKTIENAPTAAFDAGAESFSVGAAGAPVTAFLLSKREGREGCNRDNDNQNEGADHCWLPADS